MERGSECLSGTSSFCLLVLVIVSPFTFLQPQCHLIYLQKDSHRASIRRALLKLKGTRIGGGPGLSSLGWPLQYFLTELKSDKCEAPTVRRRKHKSKPYHLQHSRKRGAQVHGLFSDTSRLANGFCFCLYREYGMYVMCVRYYK